MKIGYVITASHGCQQTNLQEGEERKMNRGEKRRHLIPKKTSYNIKLKYGLSFSKNNPALPFWCTFCFSISLSTAHSFSEGAYSSHISSPIWSSLLYVRAQPQISTHLFLFAVTPTLFAFWPTFHVYSIYSVYWKSFYPHHATLFALEVPLVCECIACNFNFFPPQQLLCCIYNPMKNICERAGIMLSNINNVVCFTTKLQMASTETEPFPFICVSSTWY